MQTSDDQRAEPCRRWKWARLLDFKACFSSLEKPSGARVRCVSHGWRQQGACFPPVVQGQGGCWFSQAEFGWGPWSAFRFVSKSWAISCTYPFFSACLVSMEMQASWKRKALHLMHRQRVLFLESTEQWMHPKMSVRAGPGGGRLRCRRKFQHPIVLLWKELHVQQGHRSSLTV